MKIKLILLLIVATVLTGCGSLKTKIMAYQDTQVEDRTRVRFVSDHPGGGAWTKVVSFDEGNCQGKGTFWMMLTKGFVVGGFEKRLGIPLYDYNKNQAKEVYVRTNRPYHLFFVDRRLTSGYETITHNISGVFIDYSFEKDKDYEFFYRSDLHNPKVEVYLVGENKKELIGEYDSKVSSKNESCLNVLKK